MRRLNLSKRSHSDKRRNTVTMSPVGKFLRSPHRTGLQILIVIAFLSFKLLLERNMGSVNEVDILPKQYADPTWISGDWYLNPPGYRLLFLALFGRLAVIWGFSNLLIGRLLCYSLVSSGLVSRPEAGPQLAVTITGSWHFCT